MMPSVFLLPAGFLQVGRMDRVQRGAMNTNQKVQLTEEGLKKLQEELDHLRTVERVDVSQRIKEAKEGGDISESGEYEDAKQRQGFVEGRIRELERLLAHAEVIDRSDAVSGVVGLGSRVTVDERGERDTYTIVSRAEAGRGANGELRISTDSAVGAALMGKKVGQVVTARTPNGGEIKLKIVAVE